MARVNGAGDSGEIGGDIRGSSGYIEARIRESTARAARLEQIRDKEAALLVARAEIDRELEMAGKTIRDRLEAIPRRLRAMYPEAPEEVLVAIGEMHREALLDLANGGLADRDESP